MGRLTAAVLVSSLLIASARAEEPLRLTLDEAINRGLEESHRLAQLAAQGQAASAGADAARASKHPQISLQAHYVRTNHVPPYLLVDPTTRQSTLLYPDIPDNVLTRLALDWPIYTGGRTGALERAARAEADGIAQDLAAARADLRLEITRAFWSVVTAGATVAVLEQALARSDAHLQDARALFKAGLAPESDVLSSQARRSRQQMGLIEARNLDESSRADLRRLLGLPADAAIAVAATLAPPPAPVTAAASLIDEARADRAERRALETRARAADERRAAAEAGRLPSVSVAGGYDYARPNDLFFPRDGEWRTSWDVGVFVNWSLWDGGRVKAEAAQASAERRAVLEGLQDFDLTLESDVRQRRLDLETALATVSASEDTVRSATEARRVVAERYAAGLATNAEVLDAQHELLQAELDRTRSIANARLAAARLERALGR